MFRKKAFPLTFFVLCHAWKAVIHSFACFETFFFLLSRGPTNGRPEEPGGARRSPEEPGGARRRPEAPGEEKRRGTVGAWS